MSKKDADAYVSAPRGGGAKEKAKVDKELVQPPRKVTLRDIAAWMATPEGAKAVKTMTPRWRAVIMSAVARQASLDVSREANREASLGLGAGARGRAGSVADAGASAGAGAGGARAASADDANGGETKRRQGEEKVEEAFEEEAAAMLGDGEQDPTDGLTGEWLDAKFTALANTRCAGVLPSELVGDRRNHAERQHYKYTLDVGGHGGTSWLGTLTAMATASLVFRADSPMADFYDAELQPWVHYVPVAWDLSNLAERYLWAQNNQAKAREIAAAGAVYARDMSAEKMWASYASLPLGQARKAYHVVGPATVGVVQVGTRLTRGLKGVWFQIV